MTHIMILQKRKQALKNYSGISMHAGIAQMEGYVLRHILKIACTGEMQTCRLQLCAVECQL